jgi:hypothetical protein
MLPFKALPKQMFYVHEKMDADKNVRVQLGAVVSLDRWFPGQRYALPLSALTDTAASPCLQRRSVGIVH